MPPPSTEQKHSLEARLRRYEQHRPQLLPSLTARGLGAGAAERFRLGYVEPSPEDPARLWRRMAIPYLTPTGVVQIRYRCTLNHDCKVEGCPKYLGDAGQQVTLYNAQATLDTSDVLFLTEGELDAVAIESLIGRPAVGIPGARAWAAHPYWARCFVNFARLILPADGDEPGAELAAAVAKSLPEVTVVQLPDGDDANTVLARSVPEFFERCGL